MLPPLPEKSVLGKNSQELVNKRKQELQLYLQMLAKHPIVKYDPTFKIFLTCEDADEFESFKSNCTAQSKESSIPIASLKKLQLQDTFNYFYSSLKTKYLDTSEPEEVQTGLKLEEISAKILKYVPVLEKHIALVEGRVSYSKKQAEELEELKNAWEEVREKDAELSKVMGDAAEYSRERGQIHKAAVECDRKVLAEIKEEKLRLEGINLAILDRKSNIAQYNTLLEYSKGKAGKYLRNNRKH